MSSRKSTKRKLDKKIFSRTAKTTKKINIDPAITRGGIRL